MECALCMAVMLTAENMTASKSIIATFLAQVVQRESNTTYWINLYLVESTVHFVNTFNLFFSGGSIILLGNQM